MPLMPGESNLAFLDMNGPDKVGKYSSVWRMCFLDETD